MAAVLTGGFSLKKKFIVSLFAVFVFLVHGASDDVGADRVSVFEGESVTLHTNVIINQQDRVKWYFIDTCIARITGDLSDICTDVQCNKGTERFRNRLKLDHQTADLTITNINTSHNGVYHLKIFSSSHTGKVFDLVVHGVPAADIKRKSVKEGESVTLDTRVVKNPNDSVMWYFNHTLIAEITGDQSKICEDVQCEERFKDRLAVDRTGSLIITNTKTTDSGLYELQIKSSRNRYSTTSIKSFTVSVTDSGLSSAAVKGICAAVAVVLVFAAAGVGVIYYRRRSSKKDEGSPHDRRGSQHRAGTSRGHLRAVPPQMGYCASPFHPLPESGSETE